MLRHILCQLNCHITELKHCKEMYNYIWISKVSGDTIFTSLELYENEDECFENGLVEKPDFVSCCLEIIPLYINRIA